MSRIRRSNRAFTPKFIAAVQPVLANLKRYYLEYIAPEVVCETIGFPPHKELLAYLDHLKGSHAGAGMVQDRRSTLGSPR